MSTSQIGLFERNKGRLVARGNHQRPGIDSGESFSPVVRLRTILALVAKSDPDVIQLDINSAYLHGTLMEEVCMEQPDGYVAPGKEDWVCRLEKGLYGLVQAGRTWNEDPNAHIESESFTATPKNPTMFIKNSWTDRDFVAAGFWVDNYVAIGSKKELTALAESVSAKYGITGLGEARWVLGMLPERNRPTRTISIPQEGLIDSILTRFNPTNATTVATPLTPGTHLSVDNCPTSKDEIEEMANRPYREVARALAWLTLGTRLDIAFATSPLARFGHNPVASIGTWPTEYHTTSKAPNSGVSRWEASPADRRLHRR